MSVANDALLVALGQNGFPVFDNQSAPTTTQGTATRCIGQVTRFTASVAGGSAAAVLPSLLSEEVQGMLFVINDTPNTMKVFPFTGETEGGVANQSLSIPTGQSGVFISVTAAKTGKGGGIAPGSFTNDWRAAVIP
jgi:hypothetical protein